MIWIGEKIALAIHEEQIAEHGGLSGIRDLSLLQSALNRPEDLNSYEQPTISELAASYAIGIAKNHPFNDGNKRTAYVVMELFLCLNDYELIADDYSATINMLNVASGQLSEAELAQWLNITLEKHHD